MLRLKPTCEEMLREAKTRRSRIPPERERRTQQGLLLENVDFDEFDLSRYDIRNPNKATQTDVFDDNSNYSSVSSKQSLRTPAETESRQEQQRREARDATASRQTSISTGESMDDVRYRTRMSIADDLATMARVGGNVIYYTGQGIGQGIGMAIDASNWINDNEEDDNEDDNEDTQPPLNQEQASGSNDAIRLLRRGASRSRCETPPNKKKKLILMTTEVILKRVFKPTEEI